MRDYKNFYREAKGQQTRIYCDMDGVLCDFMTAAKKATGMTFNQSDSAKHWDIIKRIPKFWSDMPWMPGGRQLWSYIRRFDSHILSAYSPNDPNCKPGKLKWLRRNVGMSNMNKINLVRRKEKSMKLEESFFTTITTNLSLRKLTKAEHHISKVMTLRIY